MHFRLARNRNTPRLARPLAQTALRVFLPPSSTTISTTAATQLLYDRARRDPTAESQELFSRDLKGYKKLQQRVSPTVLEKARILPGPKNMALLVPRGRKRFEVDRGEHDILTRLSSMAKQVLVLQQQEEARRQKEELLEEQRIAQEQEDREILLEYQSYLEGIKGTVHLLLQRLNRQFTFIRLDRLQPRFSHKNEAYFPLAYALQALARPSFRAEDVPAPFRPLNLNPQQLITLSRFVAAQDEIRLFEPLFERRYHLYPLRTNKAHPFVPLDNMLRNAALRPLLRSSTRHATTLATAPLTVRLAGEILRLPVSDEIHALVRQAQDEGVTAVEGVLKRYLADHPTVQRRMHESIVSSARLSFEEEEEEGSRGRTVTLEPAEGRYEISSNTFSGLLQQVNDTRLRFEALTEEVNKDRQRTSALEARVSATEEELQFLNELLEVHKGLDEAKDLVLLDAPLACEAACPRFRMARLNPSFGESGPADTKLARSLLALHPGKPIPLLFRRFNLSYSDIATLSSTLTSSTYLSLHPSILRRFLKHASKRNPIVHSCADEEVVLKFISDAAEKCVPAKAEEVDEHFRASLGKLREKAQGTKKGRLRAGSKNKEGPLPGKKKEPKKVSK